MVRGRDPFRGEEVQQRPREELQAAAVLRACARLEALERLADPRERCLVAQRVDHLRRCSDARRHARSQLGHERDIRHEMQILEFVKLAEVDPIYFETSYYVAPDRAGERAYGLLFEALRQSGLVAIAQLAMHQREHVVVIRPGRTGIVLHTMFYEPEVRRENEYRADTVQLAAKEVELALLLVNSLTAAFDASKYRDSYREKLDALIGAKLQGKLANERQSRRPAAVVNIVDALQRSLDSMSPLPSVRERTGKTTRKTSHRK